MNPHYRQQLYLRPSFIVFFNFSHKRPTFAFTSESGYTLGFRRRIAHKGTHCETGAFPLSATAQSCAANRIALNAAFATLDSATLLYTYISRFSVTPHYQQQLYLRPSFIAFFNFLHKWPTFAFTSESGYTLGFQRKIAHSGPHTETRGVLDGGAITTLGAFRTFTNIPGLGIRTPHFAAFGSWPGVLPKNAESLRNSDALMRVAVPRRRGPAGLRCSVCNLVMLLFFHSARRAFHTCKRGCGITTLGVRRVLLKRWTAACQSGLFAVFLRPLLAFMKAPAGYCQYPH